MEPGSGFQAESFIVSPRTTKHAAGRGRGCRRGLCSRFEFIDQPATEATDSAKTGIHGGRSFPYVRNDRDRETRHGTVFVMGVNNSAVTLAIGAFAPAGWVDIHKRSRRSTVPEWSDELSLKLLR